MIRNPDMIADESTDKPETNPPADSGGTNTATRKPYRRPQLTVYGSIQKLTNTTSQGAKGDGGSAPMNMRTCL